MISYSVQIKDSLHCFDETVKVYRAAVRYLIDITFIHYDEIKDLPPNQGTALYGNPGPLHCGVPCKIP